MSDMGDERRLIFEVPIYRLTENGFFEAQTALAKPHFDQFRIYCSELDATIRSHLAIGWTHWHFNDIVGYVTIHGYHDMVKLYLWWTESTRLHRPRAGGSRRLMKPLGKLGDMFVDPTMSDHEIGVAVRADLLDYLTEWPKYRGRHADLRCFDLVSAHLAWRSVLVECEEQAFRD